MGKNHSPAIVINFTFGCNSLSIQIYDKCVTDKNQNPTHPSHSYSTTLNHELCHSWFSILQPHHPLISKFTKTKDSQLTLSHTVTVGAGITENTNSPFHCWTILTWKPFADASSSSPMYALLHIFL